MASPFAAELVQAYPDVKVVVVQRDFEPWWRSVRAGVLAPIFGRSLDLIMLVTTLPPDTSTRKQMFGLFRAAYERHFRRVRELVPAERRLEYVMWSGWKPLCEFLGKEAPDVPFPQLNEGKEFAESNKKEYRATLLRAWAAIKPWASGALEVGVVAVAITYRALAYSS